MLISQMMTKDDGVSSTSDVVVVGFPVSSGNIGGNIIDLPLTSLPKADVISDHDIRSSAVFTTSAVLSNVRTDHTTLQSLLAAPIMTPQLLANPETIQIITVPTVTDYVTTSQPDGAGKVWQVIPNINNPEIATIIAVNDPAEFLQHVHGKADTGDGLHFDTQFVTNVTSADNSTVTCSVDVDLLMPPPPIPPPPHPLPPDCPPWATRLKNCEKIGDSYRGYIESEVELDLLLTFHKQQTQSYWGTRQSPSPAKPSTRLMWKSQYVPFDGIPFVNAGSRAVVQECQFGPRRKGNQKKHMELPVKGLYTQTCPARIYIKKVKKFPEFAVALTLDKKSMKIAMDKAFQDLKDRGVEGWGQERYYVQLPTENAHEFHDDSPQSSSTQPIVAKLEVEEELEEGSCGQRLHPRVGNRIRELVAAGETRVYAIRKQLRIFVVKDLFQGGEIPERHDLTLFPTVNDLKNHIHQALRDIETGALPLTASTVNVEIIPNQDGTATSSLDPRGELQSFDPSILTGTAAGDDGPMPETVTVTLTQNPGEDGHHIISRIETHLSDGTTQVSTTLTPETAQLLSRLHPGMFPTGSLLQTSSQESPGQHALHQPQSQDGDDCEDMDSQGDLLEGTRLHIVDSRMMGEEDDEDDDEEEDDDVQEHVETSSLDRAHIEQTHLAQMVQMDHVHMPHMDQVHMPQMVQSEVDLGDLGGSHVSVTHVQNDDALDQGGLNADDLGQDFDDASIQQTHMIAVSTLEDDQGMVHLTTVPSQSTI